MDQKALDQALALFEGFKNNLPSTISEDCVKEYHAIVDAIGLATGEAQLHVFKIGDNELEHEVIGSQRRSFSGRPGYVIRSQDRRCDSSRFQRQIDALSHYLNSQGYRRGSKTASPTRAGAGPTHKHVSSADADLEFARLAIDEARKSVPESDGKPHPKVGAVVVMNGRVLSTAHRGEMPANHAEYVALEKKLSDEAVAGATVYTTLEPCTTRNHPKIPCAERLIERKVARVVIGMLDPDPRITGRGQRRLRAAGIITDFFPHDLMAQTEELNREFTRFWDKSDAAQERQEEKSLSPEPVKFENDSPQTQAASPHINQTVYVGRDAAIVPKTLHQNEDEKPKHNISFVEAKSVQAHRGLSDGKIYESPQALGDLQVTVACFRNEPIVGRRVQQPTLKSHIIYKDKNGEEITDASRGVWLGSYGETTVFESGKKKCLIIFLLSNQDTLKKLWNETYTTDQSWMAGGPLFRINDEGIPGDVTSVEIRLLAQDICVLRAEFKVETRISGQLPKLTLCSLSVA
jgi:pyrimidine deaminase RibD-like protein